MGGLFCLLRKKHYVCVVKRAMIFRKATILYNFFIRLFLSYNKKLCKHSLGSVLASKNHQRWLSSQIKKSFKAKDLKFNRNEKITFEGSVVDDLVNETTKTRQEIIEEFDRKLVETDKLNPLLNNPLLNPKTKE